MQEQNMTAARLSNQSGVGYLTVRRFLNGRNDTSAEKLILMLNALDFSITENETAQ
tara:strand:- start:328 stop:495 length:168 start_codon:yes stop_codon:yes gene_type:complete